VTYRASSTAVWFVVAALLLGLPRAAARADASDGGIAVGLRIGFSTSTAWLAPAEGYAYLSRLRAGGIRWVREDFTWSELEPRRGRFVWTRSDALMRNAALLGIHVLATAAYSPPWATGHPESDKYPPRNVGDYARFVRAIADRYGVRGTFWRLHPRLVQSPVTAIELWNEPWLESFWEPAADPVAYARLVRAAAVAVKARHPRITLLASGDINDVNPWWFRSLLRADPPLWRSKLVNAWSVHPYCHDDSPLVSALPMPVTFDRVLLTRSLAQKYAAGKPLWITEFGWRTDQGGHDAVSEETQARYVRDALVQVTTDWSSFVRRSFVYTWTKPSLEGQYNLLRPDGSARPAWRAIQRLIAGRTSSG
jgi:Beta-galactosidase